MQPAARDSFASADELRGYLVGRWIGCGASGAPYGFALFDGVEFESGGQWYALRRTGDVLARDPAVLGPYVLTPPGSPSPGGTVSNRWVVTLSTATETIDYANVTGSDTGETLSLTGTYGAGINVRYVRADP